MARILTFIVCGAVGMAGMVKPGIVAWAAGAEYAFFACFNDLIGGPPPPCY
jgi:hypothetical protein